MKKRTMAAVLVAASLALVACGDDADDGNTGATTPPTDAPATSDAALGDIVAIASANPDFSTLVAALGAAGLVETLQGPGPFTVFAPTNDAFAALPEGLVDQLLLPENKDALTSILTYHVVAAQVLAADVAPGAVATVEGSEFTVAVDGGSVILNDSVNVTATDILASNGVIHVIDAVLVPPTFDPTTLAGGEMEEEEAMEPEGDIVDIASGNEDFSTLVAAVAAAGLVETLQGEGPFTVFAPTNEAFEALPAGLVDALLLPENQEILVQILTYHVVAGEVLAADVEAGDVDSVEGSPITISIEGDTVVLNDSANVVAVDVLATNGVIHVIDAVILPPGLDVSALL